MDHFTKRILAALTATALVTGLTACGAAPAGSATSASTSASASTAASSQNTMSASVGSATSAAASSQQSGVIQAPAAETTATATQIATDLFAAKAATAAEADTTKIFDLLRLSERIPGCSLVLDSSADPAVLNLNLESSPASNDMLQRVCVVLLALVDEETEVEWSFPTDPSNPNVIMSAHFSTDNANYILGGEQDIKQYGASPEGLQALLNAVQLAD